MERYERLWERLLTLLGTLGDVDASTRGRIRVEIDGRVTEIVMSEGEWHDLVTIPHGSFRGAADRLLRRLTAAEVAEAPYLVYYSYDLEPSATPESPQRLIEEEDGRRVEQYLRDHPGGKGEWRAVPPSGDRP